MKITVLVVDDHPMFRDALCMMLKNKSGVTLVGEATNGMQALDLVEKLNPDIVCIDINMGQLGGIETTRKLIELRPSIKIIGLSASIEQSEIAKLIDAGAMGYVEKSHVGTELLNAIRVVSKNRKYLGSAVG
jgi:two-component system NarL family response regulator